MANIRLAVGDTVDRKILHQLVTIGNYETL